MAKSAAAQIFQGGLESFPIRIRAQYRRITTTTPSPTRGGLGWGAVLRLFNCREVKGVPSFRTWFGIARLMLISLALATLWKTRHFSQNQRFWKKQSNKFRVTKNCRVGKVKRFPPLDCGEMGILEFQDGLESLPIRIRTQYRRIAATAPSPTRGGLGWGAVLGLFD